VRHEHGLDRDAEDVEMSDKTWYRWRRLDDPGLEILGISTTQAGLLVQGHCIDAGSDPFVVRHEWLLDENWRSKSLHLVVSHEGKEGALQVERLGDVQWRIDGRHRPEFDGCEELDLSFTPICNSIALHRFNLPINGHAEMTALYVRAPTLFLAPSRQRYLRTGERKYRYIDLGVSAGFEAALQVDDQLMIEHYEGLFELLR
jgi:hypothetical protein